MFDVCDDKIRRAPGFIHVIRQRTRRMCPPNRNELSHSYRRDWMVRKPTTALKMGYTESEEKLRRYTEMILTGTHGEIGVWRLLLLVKLYLRMAMPLPALPETAKIQAMIILKWILFNVGCLKKEVSIPQTLWPNMTYSESNLVGRLYFHAQLH